MRGVPTLNAFLGRGREAWRAVRARLQHVLSDGAGATEREAVAKATLPRDAVTMLLPIAVGDYVDFYSSLEHATNLGRILRPGGEPLLPNYRHIPIGYHGRSSTVVVSGTPVRRPHGQRKAPDASAPSFGPSQQLDVELEMGWIAGPGNALGEPIPIDAAREHAFGYVLLNDWSARDIQAWEYQPLGPFLGKSFATSLSPWIVTLDALEPFRVDEPLREPEPLPYLRARERWSYDVELEMLLQSAAMRERGDPPLAVSRTNLRGMYWTFAQQLAHATSNGATLRPGDLFGTGTISGSEHGTQGSFIELDVARRAPARASDRRDARLPGGRGHRDHARPRGERRSARRLRRSRRNDRRLGGGRTAAKRGPPSGFRAQPANAMDWALVQSADPLRQRADALLEQAPCIGPNSARSCA